MIALLLVLAVLAVACGYLVADRWDHYAAELAAAGLTTAGLILAAASLFLLVT